MELSRSSDGSSQPPAWLQPGFTMLQAIRQLGGYGDAAVALGLRSRRRPRGHWQRFGAAVEELCAYLKERPRPTGASPLPTHRCAPDPQQVPPAVGQIRKHMVCGIASKPFAVH